MNVCEDCRHGEYHGLPPKSAPSWYVSTISFFCPKREAHRDPNAYACELYEQGEPKIFRDDVDGF